MVDEVPEDARTWGHRGVAPGVALDHQGRDEVDHEGNQTWDDREEARDYEVCKENRNGEDPAANLSDEDHDGTRRRERGAREKSHHLVGRDPVYGACRGAGAVGYRAQKEGVDANRTGAFRNVKAM